MLPCSILCNMLLCYKSFWILLLQELYLPLLVTQNALYNVMGVKRHITPVDLPQSVSISGDEINLTVRAVSTGVLCCNLAERKSMLKMCISKHCHEVTGFFLWVGTYCISCVVQQHEKTHRACTVNIPESSIQFLIILL